MEGGSEVICHSPPSFASPGPHLCVVRPPICCCRFCRSRCHISPPSFASPHPRSCVIRPPPPCLLLSFTPLPLSFPLLLLSFPPLPLLLLLQLMLMLMLLLLLLHV